MLAAVDCCIGGRCTWAPDIVPFVADKLAAAAAPAVVAVAAHLNFRTDSSSIFQKSF